MGKQNSYLKIILIILFIAAITIFHYMIPVKVSYYHTRLQRLYYIPIILASFYFGLRGGIVCALAISLAYLPHIMFDWTGMLDQNLNQYSEIIMFNVIGIVTGLLSDTEKKARFEKEEAYKRLKESFDQLRQSDRLKSLGELAAGIAHEIKNPLATIKGAVEIAADDKEEAGRKKEFTGIVFDEIKRIENLINDFLNFARPRKPNFSIEDIDEVIDNVLRLCREKTKAKDIKIELIREDKMPGIRIDPEQIKQVLLNMILNAIQSIGQNGIITIDRAMENKVMRISLKDTGSGIPEDAVGRIFEPFFTTKKNGTGLGLSISSRIIKNHGGSIKVRSSMTGTEFVIILPVTEGENE